MCGIFGWIKPTKEASTDLDLTNVFKKGLLNTQERGKDATGYYSIGTGIVKDSITAKDFLNKGLVTDVKNERLVIGHCRAASSSLATIKDPKNAHPFESKNFILVHNGTVKMDALANYDYTSDVDSESILAYAEKTSLRNAIASINGSAAFVLYNKTQRKMYFWTDGEKPLCLALYHGIIFFCSTRKILIKTLQVKSDIGIFPDIKYATLFERELLEFDLVKNKFTRRGIIEQKKKVISVINHPVEDESDDSTSTSIDLNYRPITVSSLSRHRELPRGCTANPKDGSKVVRIGHNGMKQITYKGNNN